MLTPHLPPWRHHKGATILAIRATPNAARNEIAGLYEDGNGQLSLKVKVTAIADKGKANKAIIQLLAKQLAVPKSGITLVSGETERLKLLTIDMKLADLKHMLEPVV